jgi:hypothetical protein
MQYIAFVVFYGLRNAFGHRRCCDGLQEPNDSVGDKIVVHGRGLVQREIEIVVGPIAHSAKIGEFLPASSIST